MNNTFYLLRHGETKVDGNVPVSRWVLTEKGENQAKQRAEEGIFDEVELIFSSAEEKAYQTAKPIAEKLKKPIERVEELNELDRDKGAFMEADDYEKAVEECLKNPSEPINNWETASNALERFAKKIDELDRKYENKIILIVGHGFTINSYFAKLTDALDRVYERLATNDFADWGIIKNHKVVRDIAK